MRVQEAMAEKVNNMERGSAVTHYRCRKIVHVLPKVRPQVTYPKGSSDPKDSVGKESFTK